jgi:hypothetical protein
MTPYFSLNHFNIILYLNLNLRLFVSDFQRKMLFSIPISRYKLSLNKSITFLLNDNMLNFTSRFSPKVLTDLVESMALLSISDDVIAFPIT